MPKKRNFNTMSKPPSTAPPDLVSKRQVTSLSRDNGPDSNSRDVNTLLASMRSSGRTQQNLANQVRAAEAAQAPAMPPQVSPVVELGESEAHSSRARWSGIGPRRVRLPAGPPPPSSWVRGQIASGCSKKHFVSPLDEHTYQRLCRGAALRPGSLAHMVVRAMAQTWKVQKSYYSNDLYYLPGQMRSHIIAALCRYCETGVTKDDLRLLLKEPKLSKTSPNPGVEEAVLDSWDQEEVTDRSNEDLFDLDLSGCIGRTITFPQLFQVLFESQIPRNITKYHSTGNSVSGQTILDGKSCVGHKQGSNMHAASPVPFLSAPKSLFTNLLPSLTHLSLALPPATRDLGIDARVSWDHLISLAARVSSVTHLSLAHWPAPGATTASQPFSMTRAKTSGEARRLLRALSKSLYRLEYLDVSGCTAWWSLLRSVVDVDDHDHDHEAANNDPLLASYMIHDTHYTLRLPFRGRGLRWAAPTSVGATAPEDAGSENGDSTSASFDITTQDTRAGRVPIGYVDWVNDWGNVQKVVINPSMYVPGSTTVMLHEERREKRALEKHVRKVRAGKGRSFCVYVDTGADDVQQGLEFLQLGGQ